MKVIILLIVLFISQLAIAQNTIRDFRCVRVRSQVDTANIQFKEIFEFWESYQDDLFKNKLYN